MNEPTSESSSIPLALMRQQAGNWAPEDDWTGVTDQKERRKLQNRLNQRAYRLRRQGKTEDSQSRAKAHPSEQTSSLVPSGSSNIHGAEIEGEIKCSNAPPHAGLYQEWFEIAVHYSIMTGSPKTDHLISLSRLNVHKAIHENLRAVGMTPEWTADDDALSIFNVAPSHVIESRIPDNLRPTLIQRNIPHHPWLDFFPCPHMRDQLIIAGDSFDDDDLCHDLMAFWDTRNTGATLLVWGPASDPQNWEVTEGFAKKWSWVLRRSPGLLASSNSWRRSRGEKPLVWRDLLGPGQQ